MRVRYHLREPVFRVRVNGIHEFQPINRMI
jgi:hypothetical protein